MVAWAKPLLMWRRFVYPAIIGNSFTGVVSSIGPCITTFKIGDEIRVTRNKVMFTDNRRESFQKYALAKVESVAKLDDEVGLDDASAVD
jgi:NADPH:quinone reductase-like Zn-dependent oxidoreductase